uniref:Integrase catalytic domain-containing protein n=1 Tax=Mycena chlorophos TaxID=658473 RepID=A0ABQ0L200_MYCCL|nr:predicted protein [Mycena chlorophos]
MNMPKSGTLTKIVAAWDDLTGTCEAMAIEDASATTLARFFWTYIYCRYGCPRRVITDNGPEVKAGFEELMKRLRIPHVRVSGYNKHANGVVEQGHFTLREAIVRSCNGKLNDWPEKLPLAIFADRITVSRITGFSPYQLLHGTDPMLPFDLFEATFLVTGFKSGMTTTDLLTLRIRQLAKLNSDVDRAAAMLVKSRFRSKHQFEQKFKHRLIKRDYRPGELVLLHNVGIENQMSIKRKTGDRFLGPYEVVRKNAGGAYILSELDGSVFSMNPVAAFRLLPPDCNSETPHGHINDVGGALCSSSLTPSLALAQIPPRPFMFFVSEENMLDILESDDGHSYNPSHHTSDATLLSNTAVPGQEYRFDYDNDGDSYNGMVACTCFSDDDEPTAFYTSPPAAPLYMPLPVAPSASSPPPVAQLAEIPTTIEQASPRLLHLLHRRQHRVNVLPCAARYEIEEQFLAAPTMRSQLSGILRYNRLYNELPSNSPPGPTHSRDLRSVGMKLQTIDDLTGYWTVASIWSHDFWWARVELHEDEGPRRAVVRVNHLRVASRISYPHIVGTLVVEEVGRVVGGIKKGYKKICRGLGFGKV